MEKHKEEQKNLYADLLKITKEKVSRKAGTSTQALEKKYFNTMKRVKFLDKIYRFFSLCLFGIMIVIVVLLFKMGVQIILNRQRMLSALVFLEFE